MSTTSESVTITTENTDKIISLDINRDEMAETDLTIQNMTDLASYNWLDAEHPTILVPGSPAVWSPQRIRPHLTQDTGARYVDQNADVYPWSPMEPAIRAIKTLHPDFDFGTVDLITDRRPLHHLLKFVQGESRSFNIAAECINGTVILCRREHHTRNVVPEGSFQGYRQTFEEAYLKVPAPAKGSTSHHRIVNYTLGGLNIVLRTSVAGRCERSGRVTLVPGRTSEPLVKMTQSAALRRNPPDPERDDAAAAAAAAAPDLAVREIGTFEDRQHLFELMTCFKFAKEPRTINDRMADVWLAGTARYMIARYQNVGTRYSRQASRQPHRVEFADVEVVELEGRVKEWCERNSTHISGFVAVLKEVIAAVRSIGGTCLVSYEVGNASLVVVGAKDTRLPILSASARSVFDQECVAAECAQDAGHDMPGN